MRTSAADISVHSKPRSHTVLSGMDATEEARQGRLVIALRRRQSSDRIAWMNGFKFFRETPPDPNPGMLKSTLEHSIRNDQRPDYPRSPIRLMFLHPYRCNRMRPHTKKACGINRNG